jgi:4-amino-4-deoxy-L-arabinose transferase-like glycosyltransferase
MKEFINKILANYTILLILAFALLLRTIFLNEVPVGLSNDELSFIINAKSISLTGKDILGSWQPWSLQPIYNTFPMSELSFLIAIPMISLFKITLFTAKLSYALFGTLLVGILYLITNKLFSKEKAIIVGAVAAISPWGIFFGRTAYDFPLAICFYMLSLAILLYSKGWKILLTFIPIFLAFYSYIGTKIIFLPFSIFTIFFSWYILNNKKYTKYYLILAIACISLFFFFLASINSQNTGQRLSEVLSPSNQTVIDKVNSDRKLSIGSPINSLVINKYTVFAKDFMNKYIGAFSPQYQLITGDSNMHVSLWNHGYFYYIDFIFLLMGFYYLFQKNKKAAILLVGLVLIAPLPAAFSIAQEGYVHRWALVYPLFIIIIGIGISYFISLPRRLLLKKLFIGLVAIAYSALFINFLVIYFLRYPIYNSEGSNFSTRILARYVVFAQLRGKFVYVHSPEPNALYRGYVLYSNSYNKQSAQTVTNNFKNGTYTLNNVKFLKGCPGETEINSDKNIIVMDVVMECKNLKNYQKMQKPIEITYLSDAGAIYAVHKDRVCSNFTLSKYPNNFKFFDLNIENLSTENFCQKYIFNKN